jgi:hypothetical protein
MKLTAQNCSNAVYLFHKAKLASFILPVLLLLLLSSCNNYKSKIFKAEINDSLHLISKSNHKWLDTTIFPKGFPLMVLTVDSVPLIKIGIAADDAFEESIKKFSTTKAFNKRGVLIYITRSPNLIQIRTGDDIKLLSQWGNITAGDKYISFQKRYIEKPDSALREITAWLAASIPVKTDIPWYKKFIFNEATGNLINFVDGFKLPSENFYGETIIKPTLALRIFEWNFLKGWWVTYLIVAFIAYLINRLISSFFNVLYSPKKSKTYKVVLSIVRIVVLVFMNIFIVLPSVSTAFILSGARLEDQIALKATGLPGAESLVFDSVNIYGPTGFWMAMLVLLVMVIGMKAMDSATLKIAMYPPEMQVKYYEHISVEDPAAAFLLYAAGTRPDKTISIKDEDFALEPYTSAYVMGFVDAIELGLVIALLCWLFLPLYITYAIIFYQCSKIIIGGYKTISVLLKYKKPVQ